MTYSKPEVVVLANAVAAIMGTIKGSRRGIFASRLRLPIIEMASAAMWLSREEQYVHIPRRPKRRTNRNVYGTE